MRLRVQLGHMKTKSKAVAIGAGIGILIVSLNMLGILAPFAPRSSVERDAA